MTSPFRYVRHFLVTWENGKLLVSQAREVVPYRTYEIIQSITPPHEVCFAHMLESTRQASSAKKYYGIGLGESVRPKVFE